MEHNNINIVIIGLGHHAKRMYLDFRDTIKHVNLVGVVDIESNKENIINYLKEKNIDVPTIFMKNLAVSDTIDSLDEDILNKFIKDLKCNSVIISTEPLAHFKYVIWALKNNLNILLDKPITTEVTVSRDVDKAKKLAQIEKLNKMIA
ncbi:MAG: Gfo/Idh/MocA family oxidoreductase, partial [Patescibacteria group bacterium]